MEEQRLKKEDEETLAKTGIKIIRGKDGKIKDRIIENSINSLSIMDLALTGGDANNIKEQNNASSTITFLPLPLPSPLGTELSRASMPPLFIDREVWSETEAAIHLYALQGEKYLAAAAQNAESGNMALAEHCSKEADDAWQKAEDAQIALDLQQQEYLQHLSSKISK